MYFNNFRHQMDFSLKSSKDRLIFSTIIHQHSSLSWRNKNKCQKSGEITFYWLFTEKNEAMPRLVDEVELVVTNNLARARARLSSSESVDLNTAEDQNDLLLVDEADEDDHLLSPSKARNRYNTNNRRISPPSAMSKWVLKTNKKRLFDLIEVGDGFNF